MLYLIGFYYKRLSTFLRARFACVTQNPFHGFGFPGNLDGFRSPYPRCCTFPMCCMASIYIVAAWQRLPRVIKRKEDLWQDQRKTKRCVTPIRLCSVSQIRNTNLSPPMRKPPICAGGIQPQAGHGETGQNQI